MPNYTKLFNSIVTSTIWTEDDKTRIVWITMLALADQNGEVHASIPGLARLAGVPLADVESSIAKFLGPDPYSRTPTHEGRRIAAIEGGWELLNHAKYRRMASLADQKDANAKRQKRHRDRNATVTDSNVTVTPRNATVTVKTDKAEAEAEAEAEESKNTPLAPQGGNATMPGRNRKKASQFEKVSENTPTMSLIGGWFGRKPTNLWTKDDAAKLKSIDPDPDDIAVMNQWFSKTREEVIAVTGFDARQTALATLLNNWSTAADRARAFKADSRR